MSAIITVGMGFGDETKGGTVDYLCERNKSDLVVRYTGGHQAAHCVVRELFGSKVDHIFSQFGSGTLLGVPTYLDRHMIIEPLAMRNEAEALQRITGKNPYVGLTVHPECPVTTPYSKIANLTDKENIEHGSCGLGIWKTRLLDRLGISLKAKDLKSLDTIVQKVSVISAHYGMKFDIDICKALFLASEWIYTGEFPEVDNIVFEGAQGVLLDENCVDQYPHVTGSTTLPTHAIERCKDLGVKYQIYGITRTYATRHGAGPMLDESLDIPEKHVDPVPGKFRTGYLDITRLRKTIKQIQPDHIMISHCDRYPGKVAGKYGPYDLKLGGLIKKITAGCNYTLSFGETAKDKFEF
jgi:adenylosuccinate synthase